MVKAFKESTVDTDSQDTQDAYKKVKVDFKCHNWMKNRKEKTYQILLRPRHLSVLHVMDFQLLS